MDANKTELEARGIWIKVWMFVSFVLWIVAACGWIAYYFAEKGCI